MENENPKSEKLRIAVIGAHPADIFDNCAGTIAHHTAAGDRVAGLILTHGARKHDRRIVDEMQHLDSLPEAGELTELIETRADVKEKEIRHIADFLGMEDIYFLKGDDAVLLVTEERIRGMARLIRKLKPDIIITHFPKEHGGIGSQHAVTGQIVMHAVELAAAPDPGDTTPPHYVVQVFFFGGLAADVRSLVWKAEGGFRNDVFIEITDVIDKKLACLDILESQGYGGDYARKRIEVCDGAFGKEVYVPYAEGFIRWRASVHHRLPVSDIDHKIFGMSDQERRAYRSYKLDTTNRDE